MCSDAKSLLSRCANWERLRRSCGVDVSGNTDSNKASLRFVRGSSGGGGLASTMRALANNTHLICCRRSAGAPAIRWARLREMMPLMMLSTTPNALPWL
eukprot:5544671-Prorocentrum_lima.AAC.1